MAWLDTARRQPAGGANYIAAIENRTGLKIGCLEEIAYNQDFHRRSRAGADHRDPAEKRVSRNICKWYTRSAGCWRLLKNRGNEGASRHGGAKAAPVVTTARPWTVLLVLCALCYFGSYYRHGLNFKDEAAPRC